MKEVIITKTPQGQLPSPKHRMQLKILWGCKRISEDVYNLLDSGNILQAKRAILNQMLDEVHTKLNVLGLLILN